METLTNTEACSGRHVGLSHETNVQIYALHLQVVGNWMCVEWVGGGGG